MPCGVTLYDQGLPGGSVGPPGTNTTGIVAAAGNVQTASSGLFLISTDTGISRDSSGGSGVFDFGKGSPGNKQGTINAQAFNASGTGAGTAILTNGSALPSCGSPPCIASQYQFFLQAPSTIPNSWGITVPNAAPVANGALLLGAGSGSAPITSTASVSTLSNPSGTELATATGTPTTYQRAAWDGSGNLIDQRGICSQSSLTDMISAAGAFATTCSIASTGLAIGTFLVVRAHGVYSTTTTSSPMMNIEINAGGTPGICPAAASAVPLSTGVTSGYWEATCYIQIESLSSNLAITWGEWFAGPSNGGAPALKTFVNPSTVAYTTTASETVSVQETATLVSGQSFNLQSLVVETTY